MSIQSCFCDPLPVGTDANLAVSGRTKLTLPLTSWDDGLVRITVDLRNGGAKFKVDLVRTMDCEDPVVALIAGSAERLADVPTKLDEHCRRLCDLQYNASETVLDYFCRELSAASRSELKALLGDTRRLFSIEKAQHAGH